MSRRKKPDNPAKFSEEVLDAAAPLIVARRPLEILDVFGGTGKIGHLKRRGVRAYIVSNELEPEWAEQGTENGCDEIRIGDARLLPWKWTRRFDLIFTSCVYGNRMSDHHSAKDKSTRLTYRHKLGRALTPGNAGMLYYREGPRGHEYRVLHEIAAREAYRVLRDNGDCLLNISDFWNDGMVHEVSAWHLEMMQRNGFLLVDHLKVQTKRMGFGQNREKRVEHENIFVFKKAA